MAAKLLFVAFVAVLVGASSAQRIWSIAIGHDWGGHEYFDAAGYLQGFGIGLIDLVCSSGNMDCRVVWDGYDNCWDSGTPGTHPSGGPGLFGGWYDACTGWVPTVERIHTFAFTLPYLNKLTTYFWVLKGRKGSFNPIDVTNKNIGFLDGWASSEQCVARQTGIRGNVLKPAQIHHYGYPQDIIAALNTNEIDAVFADESTWSVEQTAMLEKFDNNQMNCYLDGNGMMARKDSQFIQHWNTGFSKLRNGNKFSKFCKDTNKIHGKDVIPFIKQENRGNLKVIGPVGWMIHDLRTQGRCGLYIVLTGLCIVTK